jgi:HK97 family phage major capsid protein
MQNSAVAFTVSGDADEIKDSAGTANGLITLYHALKTEYARNATWVLNRTTLGAIRKLKEATTEAYIWQPGLADLRPNTILSAPYVEVPDMPSEGADTFPIAFGDWRRAYVIVDRIVMSILRDPFTQATSGNIRYIARKRVGGQVMLAEAIRKLKCST